MEFDSPCFNNGAIGIKRRYAFRNHVGIDKLADICCLRQICIDERRFPRPVGDNGDDKSFRIETQPCLAKLRNGELCLSHDSHDEKMNMIFYNRLT